MRSRNSIANGLDVSRPRPKSFVTPASFPVSRWILQAFPTFLDPMENRSLILKARYLSRRPFLPLPRTSGVQSIHIFVPQFRSLHQFTRRTASYFKAGKRGKMMSYNRERLGGTLTIGYLNAESNFNFNSRFSGRILVACVEHRSGASADLFIRFSNASSAPRSGCHATAAFAGRNSRAREKADRQST